MDFAKLLTDWYLQNRRALPWRETTDPYLIWLSEIILQQTRVAQGLPYFLAFVEAFPTVHDLASAEEQKVLKTWQGLGYYSRARNLHETAKKVTFEMAGIFPDSYYELQKLKGVGVYTAAAIASFCYDEPVAVLDGNVYRVLARVFGVRTDITSSSARKEFTQLANSKILRKNPALYNQAIMEFGAMQCVPRNPNCKICPLNQMCIAYNTGTVNLLPVKSKKAKPKTRHFNYLVYSDAHQNTIITQRTSKDIWKNLYEFPLIETETSADFDMISSSINQTYNVIAVSEPENVIHKLTHQHLHIKFWKIDVAGKLDGAISMSELRKLPVPAAIFNFVEGSGI